MVSFTSLLLVVLLALFSQVNGSISIPGFNLKTHNYKVAVSHFSLVDASRKDPYAPASDRAVMVSLFMPVRQDTCSMECNVSYMPPDTARIADEQFLVNATGSVFSQMAYTVCCGNTQDIDAKNLNVVVLEPQTDTSRLLYSNLARFVASNGVVVVLLDHPHESSIVEFANTSSSALGTVYNSDTVDLSNYSPLSAWNSTIEKAVDTRAKDIAFALKQLSSKDLLTQQMPYLRFSSPLNTASYSVVGHGLGGTVATSLSFSDPKVRFSINLSGTPPLLSGTTTSAAPIYFLGRANFRRPDDIHWPTTWRHLTGPVSEIDLSNSEIFDFADLPVIVELAQNEGKMKSVVGRGVGSSGAQGNHAVVCFVEGVVRNELLRDQLGVSTCIDQFSSLVPYSGNGKVIKRTVTSAATRRISRWWA